LTRKKQENQYEDQRKDIMVDGKMTMKFIPCLKDYCVSPLMEQERHLQDLL
jgi:hypothetical protein